VEKILRIIIADAPEALIELCGVNLLESLLRILLRLGFRRAIVFSTTPDVTRTDLAKRFWARDKLVAELVPCANGRVTARLILEQTPGR
jgi:hypothetical protein